VVVFEGAAGRLPGDGPFDLSLASGLTLSGAMRGGVAEGLRARIGSREVDVPARARLALSAALPSVTAGPADPAAWEEGAPPPADEEGDEQAEARARARKAAALPPRLAVLYSEVRAMREEGRPDPARLADIAAEAGRFPEDWLLRVEASELAATAAGEEEAAHHP
jgi:phenylalanine-4-hydroxylase